MKTILEHIGNTPLVKIEENNGSKIFAKMEGLNPGGSIKDRIALKMITEAEKAGILKKGDTIIEPTSGNTGVGLAMVAAMKGYKIKMVVPKSTNKEKIKMIRTFGGEVIFVDNLRFRKFVLDDVKETASKDENLVFLNQYDNIANPLAHYEGTAEEILKQMKGNIDYFVAGMGTGGTITGIGKRLKEEYPKIKIIGVQPIQGQAIEGLRSLKDGFVPSIIDFEIIDEIYELEAEKALKTRGELAKSGILVGPSSGAAMHVSRLISLENPGVNIVTVFPDRGERYL